VLTERAPWQWRRTLPRVAAAVAVVLGAGLVAFFVAGGLTHVDVAKLRPVSVPPAATPSPAAIPIADVGRNALPSIVTIEADRTGDEALGTGWLFDSRGDFVTNAHVIEGQLSVRITDRHAHTHVAVVVGIDVNADIAMVRAGDGFSGTPLPVNTTPLSSIPLDVVALASSRATGQGDITTERVALLHQEVPLQNGEVQPGSSAPTVYHDMFDLEGARIYQGNSGGPVLDRAGTVVGIITLASPSGRDSFAIPITRVIAELNQFAARTG
jgi:serine protease Do